MVNKLYYFDLFFLLFLGFVYTHFYDAKIIKMQENHPNRVKNLSI